MRKYINEAKGISDEVFNMANAILERIDACVGKRDKVSFNVDGLLVEVVFVNFKYRFTSNCEPTGSYNQQNDSIQIRIPCLGHKYNTSQTYNIISHELTHRIEIKNGFNTNYDFYNGQFSQKKNISNFFGLKTNRCFNIMKSIKTFFYYKTKTEMDAYISGGYHQFLKLGKLPSFAIFKQYCSMDYIYKIVEGIKNEREDRQSISCACRTDATKNCLTLKTNCLRLCTTL